MYYVSFTANEKPAGCMCVKEDMMFAELTTKFCENYGLKEDNKPTFYFNSQEIKSESTRTLKEHGIVQMSVKMILIYLHIMLIQVIMLEIWEIFK